MYNDVSTCKHANSPGQTLQQLGSWFKLFRLALLQLLQQLTDAPPKLSQTLSPVCPKRQTQPVPPKYPLRHPLPAAASCLSNVNRVHMPSWSGTLISARTDYTHLRAHLRNSTHLMLQRRPKLAISCIVKRHAAPSLSLLPRGREPDLVGRFKT